ncbi:hypothetical protein A3D85_00305 [Candidatus Amesbacteria bacterium RIFCSPHIGHO2_02_FULL_47_9]|nr:MAG: hypothetical protein A3D85_00305 [Candidatus Amesbacteria bacterium RIFCSPHIGHO2_02_FULL_47_9]
MDNLAYQAGDKAQIRLFLYPGLVRGGNCTLVNPLLIECILYLVHRLWSMEELDRPKSDRMGRGCIGPAGKNNLTVLCWRQAAAYERQQDKRQG